MTENEKLEAQVAEWMGVANQQILRIQELEGKLEADQKWIKAYHQKWQAAENERDSAQALLKDAVEVLVDVKRMAIPYQLSQDTPMSRASLSAQLGGVIQAFLARPEVVKIGGGK